MTNDTCCDTLYLCIDLRAMECMLLQPIPSIKGSSVMACFMVLGLCIFLMEVNMKDCGRMVLQSQ